MIARTARRQSYRKALHRKNLLWLAALLHRLSDVYWLNELGLAQAVWVLDVEKFGPFIVESDLDGLNLFERENAKIAAGLDRLYEGTSPATMRRFGEIDDKTQEVISARLEEPEYQVKLRCSAKLPGVAASCYKVRPRGIILRYNIGLI